MMRLFPVRPLIARAGLTRCFCACHRADDGTAPSINGCCAPGVSREDVVGAAVACDVCRRFHCVALAGRPPELDAPLSGRRWNPPSLAAVPQADGGGSYD